MDFLPSLITGGIATAILSTFVVLVRIALGASEKRGDDWRTAAQTSAAANAIRDRQVEKLIGSVEQLATTQRDMMALLQTMATERPRSPA